MVRLFVRHDVKDYDEWRRGYDEATNIRDQGGVTASAVYQHVDDPNDVTVWHDFDTAAAAQNFASSDELRDAMERLGVVGESEMWVTTESS